MGIDRKITHNMHGAVRLCSRCGKPACVLRVKSEYICADCVQKRRIKQAQTAAQPTCHCGNKARLGSTNCSTCDGKAAKDELMQSEETAMYDRIRDCEDLEEMKRIVTALAIRIFNS